MRATYHISVQSFGASSSPIHPQSGQPWLGQQFLAALLCIFLASLVLPLSALQAEDLPSIDSHIESQPPERQCVYHDPQSGVIRVLPEEKLSAEQRLVATCRDGQKRNSVKKVETNRKDLAIPDSQPSPTNRNSGFSVDDYRETVRELVPDSVRPSGLDIGNAERVEDLITPLGSVHVRWARGVESLFDKNPRRAIADAWTIAAKALSQRGFPVELKRADFAWQVIVVDEAHSQIGPKPASANSCHPAWMNPPADIYVKAKLVATGCGSDLQAPEVATNELTSVLIHELGHALEFRLMGKGFSKNQRWHAEAFATWFETLAAQFVPNSRRLARRAELLIRAKAVFRPDWSPRKFVGTPEDYACAFATMAWIVDRYSISKLLAVYERVASKMVDFETATTQELNTTTEKWMSETYTWLSKVN